MEKAKRPRPQLSCTPCRNRKLKCDRESPCGQCVKSNRTSECSLPADTRPTKRSRQSSEDPIQRGSTDRAESNGVDLLRSSRARDLPDFQQLVSRVRALEDVVFAGQAGRSDEGSLVATGTTAKDELLPSQNGSSSSLNVEGLRVRYQGGLHRFSLIEGFAEVRAFIPKAIDNPQIGQIMKSLSKLQKSRYIKIDLSQRKLFANDDELKVKIVEMLPSREVCLQLLDQYFLYWENIFRIVHTVRMRILINTSWKENGPVGLELTHLLQILLMITIGGQTFSDKNVLDADFVNDACAVVQGYLDTCAVKIKQELSTLQVWTLLILCHQVYLVPIPKVWLETGNLMRHAMTIGLHRDPSESKNILPWYSELRRRLWATILEFDLQASITYGMPMAITVAETSCRPPLNIADSDVKHDTSRLPEPQPDDQYTNTLLQRKLAQSSGLRMRAVQILARRGVGVDWTQVYNLSKDIQSLCCGGLPFSEWCEAGWTGNDMLGGLIYKMHIWQIHCQLQQQLLALAGERERSRISSELVSGASAVATLVSKAVRHIKHDEDAISYRGFLALSRRFHLQAGFQLCSTIKLAREKQTVSVDVERMVHHARDIVYSLVDALPWGDSKDVLLLAITLRSVNCHMGNEAQDHAEMEDELMLMVERCRQKLEAVPPRKHRLEFDLIPENPLVPTPESSGYAGDLFANMEDFDFADLGLDFVDDWQVSIWN